MPMQPRPARASEWPTEANHGTLNIRTYTTALSRTMLQHLPLENTTMNTSVQHRSMLICSEVPHPAILKHLALITTLQPPQLVLHWLAVTPAVRRCAADCLLYIIFWCTLGLE